MNCENNNDSGGSSGIIRSLIDEMQKAIQLMAGTDDITYRRVANGTGSVGAQLRHNLDFALSLLKGIECGLIDYNERERDARVEVERAYAADSFKAVIDKLEKLDDAVLGRPILTRSEIDPGSVMPSSIGREIECVYSHTVHHHALVREKLAGFGVSVDEELGVAPSTARYWAKRAA